jgi:hypothetical protein
MEGLSGPGIFAKIICFLSSQVIYYKHAASQAEDFGGEATASLGAGGKGDGMNSDDHGIDFREIVQKIHDGIIIADKDRKILFWSQGAEDLTGFTSAEMTGQYCHTEGRLCVRNSNERSPCKSEKCPFLLAMHSGSMKVHTRLFFFSTKWDRDLPVSLTLGPSHDSQGQNSGSLCIFKDMRDEYRHRKLAGEIQKKLITAGRIKRQGLAVDTYSKPLEEVSRDFVEAFFLDDDTLVATLAYAAGRGVSASFFTIIYKTLFHSAFSQFRRPDDVLRHVNQTFLKTTQADGSIMTASMVSYDPKEKKGRISLAGIPPMLVFARSGRGYKLKEVVGSKAGVIGVDEEPEYPATDFSLLEGEFALMSTDGLYNVECDESEPFGIRGMEKFFSSYQGADHLNDLVTHVQGVSANSELSDDLSLIKISIT